MTIKPHRREEPDWLCRLVNFFVLQWFGVRLSRRMFVEPTIAPPFDQESRFVQRGWRIERRVWPLTGWWSAYRRMDRLDTALYLIAVTTGSAFIVTQVWR